MDKKHLEELVKVENTYWWHIAKRAIVLEVLRRYFPSPGRLIEGGIGAGGNLKMFQEIGYEVTGFDILPEAVNYCRNQGIANVYLHDLQQPWPVEPNLAKVVVLLDVIEHALDPIQVLSNAAKAVDQKGGLIVTVPAYPMLKGPWDEMLGHYRRYTSRLFKDHANEASLRVAWLSHWNAFSLPAAFIIRLAEKMFNYRRTAEFPPVSPIMNNLLLRFADVERLFIQKKPLPVGLSLIGVLVHE